MQHEAKFWVKKNNDTLQCLLCPHRCIIKEKGYGICGVRQNINDRLISHIYGRCSSIAVDPIEKKPLYHFHPGSQVLSLGSVGCTFKCKHCQNYTISQSTPEQLHLSKLPPNKAVEIAHVRRCNGIAWTYNEPTIWHEYAMDTARIAHQKNLYTVYVTNGYINSEPLHELSSVLDAMNIDIKAFSDQFYKKVCKGQLAPVKQTCELAVDLGIHVEITYLVIPGLNDSSDEIHAFSQWIVNSLGPLIPVHFTRFHPDFEMMNESVTPIKTLERIYNEAKKEGVSYVYLGNLAHSKYEQTYCHVCGKSIIVREGFSTIIDGLNNGGNCRFCGTHLPIHL
ncbi:MAG: AmmeMemoRadiSam system radical SAM enzyme [Candidatus Thermoplasmatota archaeon]|nr:AmmeMemoRadiSam system radical SAM enzyme [Candidatus Thermoplasmatota archaeon]